MSAPPQLDQQTLQSSASTQASDQAEETWTFVKSKKGRRARRNHTIEHSVDSETAIPRSGPLRSVSDIAAEYHKVRADWELTPCCVAIRQLIQQHASKLDSVSEAICLGIGTFDPADGAWEAKRRTYVQLIAFLVMVEELEKAYNRKIKCIFQEPIFTVSDTAFLTETLAHTVVDTPKGTESVTSASLLYGVHLYRPLYAAALKTNLPAVFVGTGWDTWDQLMLDDASDLQGMKTLDETYRKFAFPQDTNGTAFSSTCLYWRPKPSDTEKKDASEVKKSNDETTNHSGKETAEMSTGGPGQDNKVKNEDEDKDSESGDRDTPE